MDFSFYLALGAAVVSSAVAVLAIVAPKTKTTVDDSVYAKLVALEALLRQTVAKQTTK